MYGTKREDKNSHETANRWTGLHDFENLVEFLAEICKWNWFLSWADKQYRTRVFLINRSKFWISEFSESYHYYLDDNSQDAVTNFAEFDDWGSMRIKDNLTENTDFLLVSQSVW